MTRWFLFLLLLVGYPAYSIPVYSFTTVPYVYTWAAASNNETVRLVVADIIPSIFTNCTAVDSPTNYPNNCYTGVFLNVSCWDVNGIGRNARFTPIVVAQDGSEHSVIITQNMSGYMISAAIIEIKSTYSDMALDKTISCSFDFYESTPLAKSIIVNGVNTTVFHVPLTIRMYTPLTASITDLTGHQQVRLGEALSWTAEYSVNSATENLSSIFLTSADCNQYMPVTTLGGTQYQVGDIIDSPPRSGTFVYSLIPPASGNYVCNVVVNFESL